MLAKWPFVCHSARVRRLFVMGVLALTAFARADGLEPLRREDVIDRLALAQIAAEAGDAALLAALAKPERRGQAVVALRAAVHADAPELFVPALVELARSRDPALSVEAAYSLLSVFERLTAQELAQREVLLSDVRTACAAFDKESDMPPPRADIALMVAQAKDRCVLLLESASQS